jgi:hypothetical protein
MDYSKLYLFNPDHDLALANGNENFEAPLSARDFRLDMSCLPIWYAEQNSIVLADCVDNQWFKELKTLFPQLSNISIDPQPKSSTLKSVCPWGWDAAVRKFLLSKGIDDKLLPSTTQLAEIRRISHRKTAIDALRFLHHDTENSDLLPEPGKQLLANEAEIFAAQYQHTVFKAPWSSSGKGLLWVTDSFPTRALSWCRNVEAKQGSIIGEQALENVQDFAVEFKCTEGAVSFEGYSLFKTHNHGKYKGNTLASDEAILQAITKYISEEFLLKIQHQLQLFVEKEIAPYYSGYLGIDMLVYNKNGAYLLHPCIEINLRMTMGLVARLFYDKFVDYNCLGHFYTDYFPSSAELQNDHIQRTKSMPLKTKNGKILSGYMALSPVSEHSHYRIRIEIALQNT